MDQSAPSSGPASGLGALRLGRPDRTRAHEEAWRPPPLGHPTTAWRRGLAALRRVVDVQVGSIWRDLAVLLPQIRGTLLDVGCGAQPYRPLVPREVRYIAIDTADAKSHFGYEMPDTIHFAGDRWPVEGGSVDTVLATEVLEHTPVPRVFLLEAVRVLRGGGVLLLTVPFAARVHFANYDYWRFTPKSLQQLLTDAGFVDIAVYARGNGVTVACYKVMTLILQWLFPQRWGGWRILMPVLALPFLPLLLGLAVVAHVSLWGAGGDDCLGFTVVARRGPSVPGAVEGAP